MNSKHLGVFAAVALVALSTGCVDSRVSATDVLAKLPQSWRDTREQLVLDWVGEAADVAHPIWMRTDDMRLAAETGTALTKSRFKELLRQHHEDAGLSKPYFDGYFEALEQQVPDYVVVLLTTE